jgi:hypothetical protein
MRDPTLIPVDEMKDRKTAHIKRAHDLVKIIVSWLEDKKAITEDYCKEGERLLRQLDAADDYPTELAVLEADKENDQEYCVM